MSGAAAAGIGPTTMAGVRSSNANVLEWSAPTMTFATIRCNGRTVKQHKSAMLTDDHRAPRFAGLTRSPCVTPQRTAP